LDVTQEENRDERAGKALGAGDSFRFDWVMNQAVVVSVDGPKLTD
jgi:hypothetical protein